MLSGAASNFPPRHPQILRASSASHLLRAHPMASFSLHCPKTTLQVQSLGNPRQPHHLSQLPCPNSKPSIFLHSGGLHRARVSPLSASFDEMADAKFLKRGTVAEEKEKVIPDASAIAVFMTQVADLVELVDSRDIVELQLKRSECEITIRKKDAPQTLQPTAPVAMMQLPPPPPQPVLPSPPPPPPPAASFAPAPSTPSTGPQAATPKPSTSSHPPFKCPMAGTFYVSPAPGAPPFVKVGDKVQKGQVLCIIEAMKLMNEIEADQSGTVAEVLAEDGKPVSLDTPLFIIVS